MDSGTICNLIDGDFSNVQNALSESVEFREPKLSVLKNPLFVLVNNFLILQSVPLYCTVLIAKFGDKVIFFFIQCLESNVKIQQTQCTNSSAMESMGEFILTFYLVGITIPMYSSLL